MSLQKYKVTGMSCAACQARVEKAVAGVPGVESVAVSLLTNSMRVEGDAEEAAILRAVEKAGYGAEPQGEAPRAGVPEAGAGSAGDRTGMERTAGDRAAMDRIRSQEGAQAAMDRIRSQEDALADRESPVLKRRLIASVAILLLLMYGSMGHMMWGWPLPAFFQDNHVAMGLGQMILAGVIMMINGRFFTSGFRGLIHLAPNMDTLVALGSMASFVWSVLILFRMTADQLAGNEEAVMADMDSFYFESAAMIVTLITVGKLLEALSKGRTTDALKSLLRMAPQTAVVLDEDGREREIPIGQLAAGDVFVVRPGEAIPVDGEILEGTTAVDEAALTGESIPVDKVPGDPVSAATMNTYGYIRARATRVGEDTTLAQIIRMVSDAAATKAPIAKIADRVSGIFVPVVIGIALCVVLIWLLLGADTGYALARGISVLVISCPCALGLATPVAIMVGSGVGAGNGILFKTAASLEMAGRTRIIALDKTGTITRGQPVVTDLVPAEGVTAEDLLRYAASLEAGSEHPIAGAIRQRAEEEGLDLLPVEGFQALPGSGLRGILREDNAEENAVDDGVPGRDDRRTGRPGPGRILTGGNLTFMGIRSEEAARMASEGKTPMAFSLGDRLLGIISVADPVKEDSPEAIRQLRGMGIRVVMLTGDNEATARAIAETAGVDEVIAGVLPDQKEAEIRRLAERGRVAMVGDGINDAPALTRADTGIAIGAGADVAIDAADLVLMNSRLTDVAAAIRLSRATLRNIHENLFWAFIYNILLIPLAAGLYVGLMGGWSMSPMLGAAAMSLSSFCVCMNALRLNLVDIYDPRRDRPLRGGGAKRKGLCDLREADSPLRGGGARDTVLSHKPPADGLLREGDACGEAKETGGRSERKEEKAGEETAGTKKTEAGGRPGTKETKVEEKTADKKEAEKEANKEENKTMKKTMNIEGMMCPHCEATVKKALEALDGVSEAAVSHEAGTAVVEMTGEVADDVLTRAVEEKDYKVLSVN